MLLLVNLKPLLIPAILAYAYWKIPSTLSYTVVFARRTIIFVTLLVLPLLVYTAVHGLTPFPHQTRTQVILEVMGALGMFVGLICGAICFFKDARRTPSDS
jgi:hypothetical protein